MSPADYFCFRLIIKNNSGHDAQTVKGSCSFINICPFNIQKHRAFELQPRTSQLLPPPVSLRLAPSLSLSLSFFLEHAHARPHMPRD